MILGGPCDPFLGGLMRSKLFYNNTKTISAFITLIFSKLYRGFCEPYSFTIFKTFSDATGSDNNVCDIFKNTVCQYLEDLHNAVNQYFPHGQCMMLQIIHELKTCGAK